MANVREKLKDRLKSNATTTTTNIVGTTQDINNPKIEKEDIKIDQKRFNEYHNKVVHPRVVNPANFALFRRNQPVGYADLYKLANASYERKLNEYYVRLKDTEDPLYIPPKGVNLVQPLFNVDNRDRGFQRVK